MIFLLVVLGIENNAYCISLASAIDRSVSKNEEYVGLGDITVAYIGEAKFLLVRILCFAHNHISSFCDKRRNYCVSSCQEPSYNP